MPAKTKTPLDAASHSQDLVEETVLVPARITRSGNSQGSKKAKTSSAGKRVRSASDVQDEPPRKKSTGAEKQTMTSKSQSRRTFSSKPLPQPKPASQLASQPTRSTKIPRAAVINIDTDRDEEASSPIHSYSIAEKKKKNKHSESSDDNRSYSKSDELSDNEDDDDNEAEIDLMQEAPITCTPPLRRTGKILAQPQDAPTPMHYSNSSDDNATPLPSRYLPSRPFKEPKKSLQATKSKHKQETPQTLVKPEKQKVTEWPPCTDLILPRSSSKLQLKDQPMYLKGVISDAMAIVPLHLIFKKLFPPVSDSASLVSTCLCEAVRQRINDNPGVEEYKTIKDRLVSDSDWVRQMGPAILQRVSNARNEFRKLAVPSVRANYILVYRDLAEKVNVLLNDSNYLYPSAGWKSNSNEISHQERGQPFFHIGILEVAHQLLHDYNPDSTEGFCPVTSARFPDQPEAPPALIALAATLVYACLSDWTTGEYKAVNFTTGLFSQEYERHLKWLSDSRDANEKNTHDLLYKLWKAIINDRGLSQHSARSSKLPDINDLDMSGEV
ncbi:hypothetical protein DL96DRAFT_1632249 [Flagelloscypha sp. PMI_526]|nr:hypothetical protein DL96DRAFT_1632249 [Flagelloscypha sp. PMI_526]